MTVWYVAVLTLALAAFAVLLYVWLSRTLYRHHDQELLASGDRISRLLTHTPLDDAAIAATLRSIDGPAPRFLMVRNDRGELIYRSPVLQVAEPTIGQHEALVHAAAHAPRDAEFFTVSLERSGPVRFICTPIERRPAAYVQIGSPLGDVPATLRAVAVASAVLVPLVVLLASYGGWAIAGRALAPISSIDSTLRAIEATDLSQRVQVKPFDRELRGLVVTVNGLLDRLDRAFRDLREFSANASHQLKTPLAVMKGTIEMARREVPAASGVFDDLEQDVNDMSAVVTDLQTLSLADADVTGKAHVDLSATYADAAEILSLIAESKGVALTCEITPSIHVNGDSIKLKQVLLNVGDNAIKYTPAGGRVAISLSAHNGCAILRVSDTGIGIPADQLPRIFERFYRGSAANGAARGTGLGLAIAKRIVEVHGGSIDAQSRVGLGADIEVRLPSA